MIISEIREVNGKLLKYIYSDMGLKIKKVGTNEIYDSVYEDINNSNEYVETEEKISSEDELLKLTRGDVFRGILQAKGVTRKQIADKLSLMPESTIEEKLVKELAFIDFEEALYFYRANPLIDKIGEQLGISHKQMTDFFKTNNWHSLINE